MTTDSILKTSNKSYLYTAINSTQNTALFYVCVSEVVNKKKRKKIMPRFKRD